MATISASEQLIIFCGWNKFNSANFDVNSGQAIGKDAIGCDFAVANMLVALDEK